MYARSQKKGESVQPFLDFSSSSGLKRKEDRLYDSFDFMYVDISKEFDLLDTSSVNNVCNR